MKRCFKIALLIVFASCSSSPGKKEDHAVDDTVRKHTSMDSDKSVNSENDMWEKQTDTVPHTWPYARIYPASSIMGADSGSHPWKGTNTSILDYYLNLPAKYIVNDSSSGETEVKLSSQANKMNLVDKTKKSSTYLRLQPAEPFVWEGEIQMGLFRETPESDPILGLFRYDCGPGCEIAYRFMKYKNSRWLDVTDSVFELEKQFPYAKFEKEVVEKADDPVEFHFDLWPTRNTFTLNDQNLYSGEKGNVLCTFVLGNGKFRLKK